MDEKMELAEEHRGSYALNQTLGALGLSTKAPTTTDAIINPSARTRMRSSRSG